MRGCSGGACVVSPGGACVVSPGGGCVVALGGCMRGCSGGCMRGCSVGGVHGCSGGVHGFWWGACVVFLGGHAWFFPGGMHRIRRDAVNERAVRILLECILVMIRFYISV